MKNIKKIFWYVGGVILFIDFTAIVVLGGKWGPS